MDKTIKNSISHRYKAIRSMNEYFSSQKQPTPSEEPAKENNKKSKLEK